MGNSARMEEMGRRVIRRFMPDQHRQFYPQLPFIVAGSVDSAGRPWATLIEGRPGFISSPDATTLRLGGLPGRGDPVHASIQAGAPLGLLGIELHTRRRNRMNGLVAASDAEGFTVTVGQAFGNCPQYIQLRAFDFIREPGSHYAGEVETLDALDTEASALIAAADTFFVASYFPGDEDQPLPSVDVSHRGGRPGFVRVEGQVLSIPDFAGNMHFNTLGNLLLTPRAGMVFVDFASGDLLQLSGTTEIVFDGPEVAAFQGAERIWRLRVERVVRRRAVLALRWRLDSYSPNSLLTGNWRQTEERLAASALPASWRPFRVSRVVPESSTVSSFLLEPADGHAALPHLAGQHLTIRVPAGVEGAPLTRSYTLSAAPSDGVYRISVKQDGVVSQWLHRRLREGDLMEALAPQGRFTVDATEQRPLVMLAGGIGVTSLLAMLRHLVFEGVRKRHIRPIWFIHASRTVAERPFDSELAELARQAGDAVRLVRVVSRPEAGSVPGHHFEYPGHIDMALLRTLLPLDDYDFYLCGPAGFMQSLYDGLRGLGIGDARIHAESFGPAALRRGDEVSAAVAPLAAPAAGPVQVRFTGSDRVVQWLPGGGSLLDLAEQHGLGPASGCRGGHCGSCRTPLLQGAVSYASRPAYAPAPDEALLCCAVPAEQRVGEELVLKC
ncbi:2Fe-2S iron-sulfur cluster-binding protein [Chitinimonas arctica]|nr:pyridoxamine 5'-phosphate oxidase family protein [Chitinimonas arctica]